MRWKMPSSSCRCTGWWPAIGGLAVGLIGWFEPRTLGVGYDTLRELLDWHLAVKARSWSWPRWKFLSLVDCPEQWHFRRDLGAALMTVGGAVGALCAHVLHGIPAYADFPIWLGCPDRHGGDLCRRLRRAWPRWSSPMKPVMPPVHARPAAARLWCRGAGLAGADARNDHDREAESAAACACPAIMSRTSSNSIRVGKAMEAEPAHRRRRKS